MEEKKYKVLPQINGTVTCLPGIEVEIEKCRFCVHSVYFSTLKGKIPSPARAFCNMTRATEDLNLKDAIEVFCDDISGEGFRSMMNVIS